MRQESRQRSIIVHDFYGAVAHVLQNLLPAAYGNYVMPARKAQTVMRLPIHKLSSSELQHQQESRGPYGPLAHSPAGTGHLQHST